MNPIDFLISCGVDAAVAEEMVRHLGVVVPEDFTFIAREDLGAWKLTPVQVGKVLRGPNQAAAPPAAPVVVTLAKERVPTSELTSPHDVLDRLGAEPKAALARLAELRVPVVTGEDGTGVDTALTRQMWDAYLGNGLACPPWYNDRKVHTIERNEPRIELDPYEMFVKAAIVPLINGKNAQSGVDWSGLTVERRALLHFVPPAQLAAEHPDDVASVLRGSLSMPPDLVPRWVQDAEKAAKRNPGALQGAVNDVYPKASTIHAISAARASLPSAAPLTAPPLGPARAKTPRGQLTDLLLALFSTDELRRIVRYSPTMSPLDGRIMWGQAPMHVAGEVVENVERSGLVADLLREARAQRGGRLDEVEAVAAAYKIVL